MLLHQAAPSKTCISQHAGCCRAHKVASPKVPSRCASQQRPQGCIDQHAGCRQHMRRRIPEILHRWHRLIFHGAVLLPCSLLGLERPNCCFPAALDSTCFVETAAQHMDMFSGC